MITASASTLGTIKQALREFSSVIRYELIEETPDGDWTPLQNLSGPVLCVNAASIPLGNAIEYFAKRELHWNTDQIEAKTLRATAWLMGQLDQYGANLTQTMIQECPESTDAAAIYLPDYQLRDTSARLHDDGLFLLQTGYEDEVSFYPDTLDGVRSAREAS